MKVGFIGIVFLGLIMSVGASGVHATLINFDDVTAPSAFMSTARLTETYAGLGVHFAGPGGLDGGAILNQGGNFGVNALSGVNFLAFNRGAQMNDGGIPRDPERITFDQPWGTVTIWAAGGSQSSTFVMNAYDSSNAFVGSSTVTTQDWQSLSVSYAPGIKWVELSESGGSYFVYDNLSYSAPVPIPATLLLFGPGLVGLAAIRRRFKK